LIRSRSELLAENALLRQQLIVAARRTKRPKFVAYERGLVLRARLVPRWWDAILLVKPETLLCWHREGFWLWWRWRSKTKNPTPKISAETIALIQRMTRENRLWGADRIRGELRKVGIRIAKLSVAARFEGCGIEKNEGRRVERSEGFLVGLGLAEDGENDAAVRAQGTKETSGGAKDIAGAAADGRVVVGGWVVDERAFEDERTLECEQGSVGEIEDDDLGRDERAPELVDGHRFRAVAAALDSAPGRRPRERAFRRDERAHGRRRR
jgi:hypothetical protein